MVAWGCIHRVPSLSAVLLLCYLLPGGVQSLLHSFSLLQFNFCTYLHLNVTGRGSCVLRGANAAANELFFMID